MFLTATAEAGLAVASAYEPKTEQQRTAALLMQFLHDLIKRAPAA
jgi:hypothetical protein